MTVKRVLMVAGILLIAQTVMADDPPVTAPSSVAPFQLFVTHCVAMNTRYARHADAASCQGMASRSFIVQGDAARFLLKASPAERDQFAKGLFRDRFNQVEQGQDMSKLAWFLTYEQSHPTEVVDSQLVALTKDIMNPTFGVDQVNRVIAKLLPTSPSATDANAIMLGSAQAACLTSVPWRDITIPAVVPEKGKAKVKNPVKVVACMEADPNAVIAAGVESKKTQVSCLPEPQAVVDSCVKILAGNAAATTQTLAAQTN